MHLKRLELNGFKSFAKKSDFVFDVPIIAIVGPNGSGKSNVVEAIRFVLGEQSVKSMRGKTGSDLIFKGSRSIPKMSRASATIVFDNSDRVFYFHQQNNTKINVDFDEIVISREVYSDGANKYTVNGHEVRMKDVHELIASINIGASGHHIISQGEADRYLNANIKDRRELIEEALGLKIYQYRLKESVRKLERAQTNLKESEMLRRELAPHIRFLKRQVDKIEKAKHLREELNTRYKDYFSKEDCLINTLKKSIESEQIHITNRMSEIQKFLETHQNPDDAREYPEEKTLLEKKHHIQNWQDKVAHNSHELGKIEGMISLLKKQEQDSQKPTTSESNKHPGFSYKQVKTFLGTFLDILDTLNAENISRLIPELKAKVDEFTRVENAPISIQLVDNSDQIIELNRKRGVLVEANAEATKYINELTKEISELEDVIENKRNSERESQKQYYEYLASQKEIQAKQEILSEKRDILNKRENDRKEEYDEALVLLGQSTIEYESLTLSEDVQVSESSQEQSRRELERTKIRLEDIGGGSGAEVTKEYEETLERDQFLAKEISDVENTIESLNSIIADLKQTLNTEFEAGVKKINVEFDKFFKLMFGGGSAELESALIQKRRRKKDLDDLEMNLGDDEEEAKEYGIDIKVKLPRKKVSDLEMLSGGERSLTSIALLFALSQVNPPPFLILDETDASLDEANSQKYGNMIEALSEFSQLVLVTHNRETMSRAHTLFGVTLGRDDSSTMLSLRLEDATQYAK